MHPKIELIMVTTLSKDSLPLEHLHVRGSWEVITAIDDLLYPAKDRRLLFIGGSRIGGMRVSKGSATWPEIYGLIRTAEYLVNHPGFKSSPEGQVLKEIRSSEKMIKIDPEACRWLLHLHKERVAA